MNTEGILPLSDYTMNELKKSIKNGKVVYDINYYRNDTKTIEKHIDFLTNENQKEIYKILTKSIQNVEKL